MRRWRKCGQALGLLPSDGTTRSHWEHLLGEEMAAVEPFLRKRGTAGVVHRPDAQGRLIAWRVVPHAKADLVGIDDDSGERIDLAFAEAQVWTLDWTAVLAALRAGLGLSGTERQMPDARLTWEVGRFTLNDHQTAPILLCGAPRHHLGRACDRILAEGLEKGVLLVGDPGAMPPEAVARLRSRNLLVVGLCDAIAVDLRGRLIGLAGPESIIGDLRVRLGLAPVDRPAYQFIRTGSRWDIVFAGASICVDHEKGMHYICLLLDKPGTPIPVQTLVATVADVDRHLLQGSNGAVNDRQSRAEYMAEYRRLQERIDRLGEGHPAREKLEADQDRIMEELQAGDGLGGEDRIVTSGAQMGRAAGNAINRAIDTIAAEPDGATLAAHLKECLKNRTGQKPVYQPATAIAWITVR